MSIIKLFQERRKNLQEFNKYLGRKRKVLKKEIPENLYCTCDSCKQMILVETFNEFYICPHCGHYHKWPIEKRFSHLFDQGKYKEYFKVMKRKNPLDFEGYEEKLIRMQKATQLNECVKVVKGEINHHEVMVIGMDSRFFMASMGENVGEKITLGIELALKKRLPLLIICTSGGARMQEGLYSLMQMAKVTQALYHYHQSSLLHISYLTSPTMGGVTASFALIGDINIAEPHALIGFAGRRVIESTIKQELPKDFQTSEFLLQHGFIDMICERSEMKEKIALLLKMHKVVKS